MNSSLFDIIEKIIIDINLITIYTYKNCNFYPLIFVNVLLLVSNHIFTDLPLYIWTNVHWCVVTAINRYSRIFSDLYINELWEIPTDIFTNTRKLNPLIFTVLLCYLYLLVFASIPWLIFIFSDILFSLIFIPLLLGAASPTDELIPKFTPLADIYCLTFLWNLMPELCESRASEIVGIVSQESWKSHSMNRGNRVALIVVVTRQSWK